jgi:exopolysaccharide biosynthesis WecB/TagA/CpsF family protein
MQATTMDPTPRVTSASAAALGTHDTHAASRVLDGVLAAVAIVLLLPLLVLRGARARTRTGRALHRTLLVGRRRQTFEHVRFADEESLSSLAALWNVLRGDLALVGPRPLTLDDAASVIGDGALRFLARPGLVSRHALRQRLGIAYEAELDDDADFALHAGLGTRLGVLARALVVRVLYGSDAPAAASERLTVFGIPIANDTMEGAIDWIVARAHERTAIDVAFVNPHCLNVAWDRPDYREALRGCERVLPDGIGVRIACQLRRLRLRCNVNGTDMFPRLMERLAHGGLPVFFLGARPDVAQAAADAMRRLHPSLRVAGMRHGFFGDDDEDALVEEINRSGARVLLVAMGVPRQELWLAAMRDRLHVPVRIGVGGLFDFYSGRLPRAPRWMRELGFEWLWRLAQEPGRMWRRYLVGNLVFLWRAWRASRPGHLDDPAHDTLLRLFDDRRVSRARRDLRARRRRAAWRAARAAARVAKRTIDVAGALVALALLSPLLAVVAVLIRLESEGPMFYSQIRVGRGGREFRILKFRSMYADAEARQAALAARNQMQGGVIFKMRDDPRVTSVGRVIRKLSIDELPQLLNVLRGDMSLVGPRPPLPSEVVHYALGDRRRLDAVPGITCIWQVSGRSEIPFDRQVELDVDYIERQSFALDLRLLLRTIPAVLLGRGAY